MHTVLYWSLLASLAINALMFLVAFWRQSDKLTDASYAISFIAVALVAVWPAPKTPYTILGVSLVFIWALRIGGFLLYRVLKNGSDRRFDGVREHFLAFGRFWLGQAVTAWVLLIPLTLALPHGRSWTNWSLLGAALWLIGFSVEAVADLQKYRFTHGPHPKQPWIDRGLWRYSRHPNYFGEITVWIGIYCFTLPVLPAADKLLGLTSPVLITGLLLFVSGIPILEKRADARWGINPAYRAYKRRTSLLVPLPPKKNPA